MVVVVVGWRGNICGRGRACGGRGRGLGGGSCHRVPVERVSGCGEKVMSVEKVAAIMAGALVVAGIVALAVMLGVGCKGRDVATLVMVVFGRRWVPGGGCCVVVDGETQGVVTLLDARQGVTCLFRPC